MTGLAAILCIVLAPTETPEKALDRAAQLYRDARFNESLALTDAILAKEPSGNVRVECRALRAYSLFFLGLYPAARDEWLAVLELKADYIIDAVEHSPEVIAFFSRVRPAEKSAEPITVVEPVAAPDPYLSANAAPASQEPQCKPWLCLVPFGVGQFVKRDWIRGSIFAGLSAVFLGTNIGLYQSRRAEYDRLGYLEDLEAADRSYLIQNVAFGLLVGTVAVGIVDAYLF